MKTGHRNFLLSAVYFLYVGNREKEAARWYAYLQEKYPQAVLDKNGKKMSLDNFAIREMMGDVSETDHNKTTQAIQGLLMSSFSQLAQDDDDRALRYANMAQQIWTRYQSEIDGSTVRVGLDSMDTLKRVVRDQVFDTERGFSPEMRARLRSKLGMAAPTNAPPVEAVPK
jgi:hypothetical protein